MRLGRVLIAFGESTVVGHRCRGYPSRICPSIFCPVHELDNAVSRSLFGRTSCSDWPSDIRRRRDQLPVEAGSRCRSSRWTWISRFRRVGGRKRVSKEVRALIFRMVAENPTWGAPRIHGELLKLGFDVSERSVSRWIRRAPRYPDPAKRWLTFLRNHGEAIAAMDFFTSQRSGSVFCTAFSLSATIGVRSCISM